MKLTGATYLGHSQSLTLSHATLSHCHTTTVTPSHFQVSAQDLAMLTGVRARPATLTSAVGPRSTAYGTPFDALSTKTAASMVSLHAPNQTQAAVKWCTR